MRIISSLFNTLTDKKIAVLGFAFKKDTSDTRGSPAITLVSNFIAEHARVAIYDPQVKEEQIKKELLENGVHPEQLRSRVDVLQSPYEACAGADAVVLATDWDEFSNRETTALTRPQPANSTVPRLDPIFAATPRIMVAPNAPKLDTPPKSPSWSPNMHSKQENQGCVDEKFTMTGILGRDDGIERLDWACVARSMKKPMFVFDGRNALDSSKLEALGFRVEAIGKPGAAFQRSRDRG